LEQPNHFTSFRLLNKKVLVTTRLTQRRRDYVAGRFQQIRQEAESEEA
jgi:hypothetical protein